jgi:ABC-2 type transport system ATP-binding protein
MRKLIRSLKEKHTVLLSSHILTEISQTCDRLMIIQDGRLVDEGAESELASRHGGQGKSMAVSVRGERKAVEGLLLQKNAVTGFECVADEGGILELRVELAEPKPEALAEILVQGGFGLRRLEPVKSELESMFLKLTGASAS